MSSKFSYKYEAPTISEREEIEAIYKAYLPKTNEENSLERLRYLDRKVKYLPIIFAITFGIIGILLFGTGMTFFLEWINLWYLGIPFVILGFMVMFLNYFIFKKLSFNLKEKHQKEIIALANSLLK